MDDAIWRDFSRRRSSSLTTSRRGALARLRSRWAAARLDDAMHHRVSKDIDLFLHDAQWLARLTPRLNDRVAEMVRDYSEQANSIKLVLAQGDIDFVVAGSVTGVAPEETLDFRGREILLEATEEILAKKLFYRAACPRSTYKLAARRVPDLVAAARAPCLMRPLRGNRRGRDRDVTFSLRGYAAMAGQLALEPPRRRS